MADNIWRKNSHYSIWNKDKRKSFCRMTKWTDLAYIEQMYTLWQCEAFAYQGKNWIACSYKNMTLFVLPIIENGIAYVTLIAMNKLSWSVVLILVSISFLCIFFFRHFSFLMNYIYTQRKQENRSDNGVTIKATQKYAQ